MPGSAPARIYSANVVHAVRGSINVANTTAGVLAGIEIGTIPAGSFVLRATASVTTTIAGGTPVPIVGTTGDDDGFMTAANLTLTPGMKTGSGAQLGDFLTADSPVVVKITGGATTGVFQVVVEFYPHVT